MLGIIMSNKTTSTGVWARMSRAVCPLGEHMTRYSRWSRRCSSSKLAGSSSTAKTVGRLLVSIHQTFSMLLHIHFRLYNPLNSRFVEEGGLAKILFLIDC